MEMSIGYGIRCAFTMISLYSRIRTFTSDCTGVFYLNLKVNAHLSQALTILDSYIFVGINVHGLRKRAVSWIFCQSLYTQPIPNVLFVEYFNVWFTFTLETYQNMVPIE